MKKNLLGGIASLFVLVSCSATTLTGEKLHIFVWTDYYAPGVIEEFENQTGIQVVVDYFSENEEMLNKFEKNPTSYDIIQPSDWVIEMLIAQDRLEVIDFSKMPQTKNLLDDLRKPPYDPTGEYSLPHFWGTMGILYNQKVIKEPIESLSSLFDERYRGRIIMPNAPRDTIGAALKFLGYSYNTTNADHLKEAQRLLEKQKGLLLGYFDDAIPDLLISKEADIAYVWSGYAAIAISEDPDLAYIIPKEGSNIWVDAYAIPKGAPHKEAAERFIDFTYKTDIAYQNWEYSLYPSPQKEVKRMVAGDGYDLRWYPDIKNSPQLEFVRSLPEETKALYNDVWIQLKSH